MCRTFEEPMAGRTKSYCKIRSVANMLSCTSNLADRWFAFSTMKRCWGALYATQQKRPFADTVQNTSTATTIYACTKVKSFGNQKCTRAHIYVGPDDLRVLRPTQRPKKRGRPKTARYKWKRRTVKSVAESMGRVYHAHYQDVLEHF